MRSGETRAPRSSGGGVGASAGPRGAGAPKAPPQARKWAAAALVAALFAGCDSGPPSGGATGSAQARSSARASAPDAAASGTPAEQPLSHFERLPVDAAIQAQAALTAFLAAPSDTRSYLAFRRAVSWGDPFFRERGFMAEALFGAGPADETQGPLGRLDAAVVAGDRKAIEEEGGAVKRALRLLQDSFERNRVRPARVPFLLPRAAFALGAILAASRPGVASSAAGVVADAQGHLDAIDQMMKLNTAFASVAKDRDAAASRVQERIAALRKALDAAALAGELSERARLIVVTGELGADIRSVLGPSSDLWRPYPPAVSARESAAPAASSTPGAARPGAPPGAPSGAPSAGRQRGGAQEEPTSVLTIPRLRRVGEAPEAELARLAALGEKLFSDKSLSAGSRRSCATCHVPEKAYTDGKPHPDSLLPDTPIVRNAPSLLYSALHAAQFWDGRALTASSQAELVLHSKAEMGDAPAAFPNASAATAADAARALAAFELLRLAPAAAPMDRFARGDAAALSDEERQGFDVFAGKGRCSRCHVPPLFGGAHPSDFATPLFAVLGVPATPAGKALDPDPGRGAVTGRPRDASAFKTPTLRNVDRTAPYFHNGAFPTLESVVDFYDKGGGRGLGLAVPAQDPEVRKLDLTAAEKKALLRFLRVALADPAKRAP